MGYAAYSSSSYRVPRTLPNRASIDAQQNSESGIDAISHNFPEPFCNTDHDPRYSYPVVDSQWNDGAEPDAISENPLEPSLNIDHAASRWSSCRTPEHPSKWPSDWSLANTRQNCSLQVPVNVEEEQPAQPKCTACWTELNESTTSMPCGHYWCSSCIVRRFTKIHNQTEWPVRCHHTSCIISLDTAKPFLRDEDIQRLTSLIEELETAVMDRVYCSNTKCSTFIPRKDTENRIAHCEVCQTNTCSDCKGAAHESDDCPLPDQTEQKVLIKSHKEKWQRCTRCGQMCERISGCSRIECLCG